MHTKRMPVRPVGILVYPEIHFIGGQKDLTKVISEHLKTIRPTEGRKKSER